MSKVFDQIVWMMNLSVLLLNFVNLKEIRISKAPIIQTAALRILKFHIGKLLGCRAWQNLMRSPSCKGNFGGEEHAGLILLGA